MVNYNKLSRRVVDFKYLLTELQKVFKHCTETKCDTTYIQLTGECIIGLCSIMILTCKKCNVDFEVALNCGKELNDLVVSKSKEIGIIRLKRILNGLGILTCNDIIFQNVKRNKKIDNATNTIETITNTGETNTVETVTNNMYIENMEMEHNTGNYNLLSNLEVEENHHVIKNEDVVNGKNVDLVESSETINKVKDQLHGIKEEYQSEENKTVFEENIVFIKAEFPDDLFDKTTDNLENNNKQTNYDSDCSIVKTEVVPSKKLKKDTEINLKNKTHVKDTITNKNSFELEAPKRCLATKKMTRFCEIRPKPTQEYCKILPKQDTKLSQIAVTNCGSLQIAQKFPQIQQNNQLNQLTFTNCTTAIQSPILQNFSQIQTSNCSQINKVPITNYTATIKKPVVQEFCQIRPKNDCLTFGTAIHTPVSSFTPNFANSSQINKVAIPSTVHKKPRQDFCQIRSKTDSQVGVLTLNCTTVQSPNNQAQTSLNNFSIQNCSTAQNLTKVQKPNSVNKVGRPKMLTKSQKSVAAKELKPEPKIIAPERKQPRLILPKLASQINSSQIKSISPSVQMQNTLPHY